MDENMARARTGNTRFIMRVYFIIAIRRGNRQAESKFNDKFALTGWRCYNKTDE
jgi:hypothetical protein